MQQKYNVNEYKHVLEMSAKYTRCSPVPNNTRFNGYVWGSGGDLQHSPTFYGENKESL